MKAIDNLQRYEESDGEGGGVYPSRNGDYVKLSDVRAALAASGGNAAPDGAVTDYGTIPELADEHSVAWMAVTAALDKGAPGWLNGPLSGMDSAVKAIEDLCAKRQAITDLQIVQFANSHLTTSDYIWSGDVEQLCIFARAIEAASAPNAALVASMTATEISEMWRGLCAGGKSFGNGVGVVHIVKAVEAHHRAISDAGQEVK